MDHERKVEIPVCWTRKVGRSRSSLLYQEGRTEADPVFLTKKGRKEKYILLDLDDLIKMYQGGKASV